MIARAGMILFLAGANIATAAALDCARLAESFQARLVLVTGTADEDGSFVSLREQAQRDLQSCPRLEPERYFMLRMAELGFPLNGAHRADGADPAARDLAENALRDHIDSVRIATVAARLNGSIESARQAAALDGGYAPARVALAAALARQGDNDAALAALPGNASNLSADALLERARIKLAKSDPRGSLADVLAARKAQQSDLEPTPGRIRVRDTEELLGLSLNGIGKKRQAKKHLEIAASLGSNKAREALSSHSDTR